MTAIVDDTGSLIKYSEGDWREDGMGTEFNGTTRYTETVQATITFSFVGTSILVFGSRFPI